jgi:hypothetical protein
MRHALGLALMILSITSSGCALVQDSCRNVCVSLKTPLEEHREKARNRQWAEAAWQQVACTRNLSGVGRGFSEDYANGFKDGFAEYLFRGGDGEPPLVAPLRYRDTRYQTEQGYHAVQDWFAGYRHGAAMARDSGARRWITGPSSLQGELASHPMPQEPPLVDRPVPEKLTPIPLPQPKVLPTGAKQVSIEAAPFPVGPIEADMGVSVPMKAQLDRPLVQQEPTSDGATPLPPALLQQIRRITEAAQTVPEPASDGPTEGAKIRITGIHDAPTPTPVRARITGIIATPQKD